MIRIGAVTLVVVCTMAIMANTILNKLDESNTERMNFEGRVTSAISRFQLNTNFALSDMTESLKNNLEFQMYNLTAYDREQITCLAENMYFEALGQPMEGLVAVALVTYNRVKAEEFPDTLCDVIKQANYHNLHGKMVLSINFCQFSWYCDGKEDVITNRREYDRIYDLAREFYISKDFNLDITDGALFYHANYVSPSWSKTFSKTTEIGDHLFYNPKDT